MTSMSLPSIHEMFPDHLMKTDHSTPPSLPHGNLCSTTGCHCSSSTRFHHKLSSPAPLTKSADPSWKSQSNSGPYSGPLFKRNQRHDPASHSVAKFHPRSEPSTAPYSYPSSDSHPPIKPPFGIDASRIQGHSPHLQGPDYRTRRLSSSDNSHPQLSSNRSFPCHTNGANIIEPDYDDDESMASLDGAFLVNNLDALGRKHVCPTCFKRFNRPSSLRIHLNTHTGATPFKCPWPNCGREFNVNSNMRRHYRNHLGAPRGQGQFPAGNELRPLAPATMHSTHRTYSDGSANDHSQSRVQQRWLDDDCESHNTPRLHVSSPRDSLSPSPSQGSSIGSRASSPTGTERHSSERSPKPKYSASKPYSASFTDARVRTTLRPAFARGN